MVIKCEWQEENRILVNPDGQVLPCCYMANFYFYSKQLIEQGRSEEVPFKRKMRHDVMSSYHNNKENYNIFENDMSEIVNGEWFVKTLPESFESETTAHSICLQHCRVKNENT